MNGWYVSATWCCMTDEFSMQHNAGHTVSLLLLLQASSGVVAATPYAVVTLVELPDEEIRVTPGRPIAKESLQHQCYAFCSSVLYAYRLIGGKDHSWPISSHRSKLSCHCVVAHSAKQALAKLKHS